jgi:hypothetical protein
MSICFSFSISGSTCHTASRRFYCMFSLFTINKSYIVFSYSQVLNNLTHNYINMIVTTISRMGKTKVRSQPNVKNLEGLRCQIKITCSSMLCAFCVRFICICLSFHCELHKKDSVLYGYLGSSLVRKRLVKLGYFLIEVYSYLTSWNIVLEKLIVL